MFGGMLQKLSLLKAGFILLWSETFYCIGVMLKVEKNIVVMLSGGGKLLLSRTGWIVIS